MTTINELWKANDEEEWNDALKHYWKFVKSENKELELELNNLKLENISDLDSLGWYNFLNDKYFRWKYTAPNRYATTTASLAKYKNSNQLDTLFDIKERLLRFNISDISTGLNIAKEIYGLGIAGASGLLCLMYPDYFGTVDQFAVKALCKISSLPEFNLIKTMNPENISRKNGVVLINIMQRKAKENNKIFNTDFWTPRKIDMILWASRE
jgi:hypothetical protein